MQNDIIFCDRCGCELTSDSVHYFEDEYLCSDCLDDSTIVCSYCGERIWSDDNAGTMSMPLCDRCYDNHYTSCEDCGRIIHQDYANYYDDDDCPYCDNCSLNMATLLMMSKTCSTSPKALKPRLRRYSVNTLTVGVNGDVRNSPALCGYIRKLKTDFIERRFLNNPTDRKGVLY